jgi:hypothetical protein
MIGGVGPAACFLLGCRIWGLAAAVALTAGWNCSWQAVRWFQRRPFSGLLLVGLLELGLRTTIGLALHSARLFFLAPAVATAATGLVYIASSRHPRPLLVVVLADLLPSALIDLSHPRTQRMIRAVSILYGAEQIFVAAISILMVLTLSTPEYVAAHLIVSWSIFAGALMAAVIVFRREPAQLISTCRLPQGSHLILGSSTEIAALAEDRCQEGALIGAFS